MNQKTITKAVIVDKICQNSTLERSDALRYVNELIRIMTKAIHDDGYLQIHRFGRFEKYKKEARKWRNPQTGEYIILPGRNLVIFRISRIFREKLNPKIIKYKLVHYTARCFMSKITMPGIMNLTRCIQSITTFFMEFVMGIGIGPFFLAMLIPLAGYGDMFSALGVMELGALVLCCGIFRHTGENNMLTLTEQAKACILEKFGRDQLLRLDISPRGCGSPDVTLHPDIADKDDRQLEVDGIRILMRTSLYDTVQTSLAGCG